MAALPRQPWQHPLALLAAAATLLVAATGEALPPLGQSWWQKRKVSCLQSYQSGCSAIQDEQTCLRSRDGSSQIEAQGLKIQGEPCAWCGGGACRSNSTSLCEPFDFLVQGEGVAFSTFTAKKTYRVASCGPSLPAYYDYSCLKDASSGCGELHDAASCLSARDGRDTVSENGLLVHGQPCVWCGGLPCHASDSSTLCQPFDSASSADSKDGFPTRRTLRLATCRNDRPAAALLEGIALTTPGYFPPPVGHGLLVPHWVPDKPSKEKMDCLTTRAGGCSAIQDANDCLSSRDGSSEVERDGFKVRGEPCVWCGGGACHSGNLSTKCEPFDYIMMGQGAAFTTFLARDTFSVASCQGTIRKPPFDYKCLNKAESSCSKLTKASECLSSTDGSSTIHRDGLRVAGEPCVWCGGHSCHSGEFTLCEPFDWVVNGEGRGFNQFYAKVIFTMAACTEGEPYPHNYFGPTNETPGVPKWHWTPSKAQLALVVAGGQCGGEAWHGSTKCEDGYVCEVVDSTLSKCVAERTPAPVPAGTQAAETPAPTPALEVAPRIAPRHPDSPTDEPPPPGGRVGANCWDACGRHGGGHCEWCGHGLACCRRGWPSNPPECWDVSSYKAPWRHECIIPKDLRKKMIAADAAAGANSESESTGSDLAAMAPNATGVAAVAPGEAGAAGSPKEASPGAAAPAPGAAALAPGAVAPAPGAAAPAPGVVAPLPGVPTAPGAFPVVGPNEGPGRFDDQRSREAAGNDTNASAYIVGDHGGEKKESFSWVLIGVLIFLICCLMPALSYYLYSHGCPDRKRLATSRKKTRHVEVSDLEDSMAGRDKPLVSDTDDDRDEGKEESSLFDLLDLNHDGIVTQEEFNQAMGLPPGGAQAPASPVGATSAFGQPVMSQTLSGTPTVMRQYTQYRRDTAASARSLPGSPPMPRPPMGLGPLVGPPAGPLPAQMQGGVDLYTVAPWGANARQMQMNGAFR